MLELIKELVAPYKCSVKTHRPYGILSPVRAKQIKIEEKVTEEIFGTIYDSLFREFGAPLFVHAYYGFIFRRGKTFIAYNIIEEYYGYDAIDIFLFKRIPLGKKIEYGKYTAVESAVKSFAESSGLTFKSCNSYCNIGFNYLMGSDKFQLLLTIKNHSLLYYISTLSPYVSERFPEQKLLKSTPKCNGKQTIDCNDIESLKHGLNVIAEKMKEMG